MYSRLWSAKLLWRQFMHLQAPRLKTKIKWQRVILALLNQNNFEQKKENAKSQLKILSKLHQPA